MESSDFAKPLDPDIPTLVTESRRIVQAESSGGDPTEDVVIDTERAASTTSKLPLSNARWETHPLHLLTSTLLSLGMVLALLFAAKLVVPSLVESVRYGWHRGELRAEYELSGQRLKNISLNSLAEVSQLVSQRVGPSVVHISLLQDEKVLSRLEALFGPQHPSAELEGQGSGFVIDSDGYILTNQHVVERSGRIQVTLSDGRQFPAYVVGVDKMTDLAVLKIDSSNLMPVEWGDSDNVVVGTPVWGVGSPFGLQQTVTFGIISGKHRVDFRGTRYSDSMGRATAYGDMMQSDVALNPGNSGGPLVNSLGQVVGVNAAILGETYHGISFSIPSKVAKRVAEELIQRGEVARGWLGVMMDELPEEERYDADGKARPGVRVSGFPPNGLPSPARAAGIQVDDIIIQFNGKPVMSHVDLKQMIGESEINKLTDVTVLREGKRTKLSVKIGRMQASLQR